MVNDIISVNGISKSFGPISALCDVSLSVQQGLVTAIVGDNGSGKSLRKNFCLPIVCRFWGGFMRRNVLQYRQKAEQVFYK